MDDLSRIRSNQFAHSICRRAARLAQQGRRKHLAGCLTCARRQPHSAIEIAQADSKMIYVGTEDGGIYRSTDGGKSWSEDLASPALPGFTITRILTSPLDAQTVYVTVANVWASHVFRSKDGGATWTDIDRGRLPDAPHHAVAISRAKPSTVYVCSDVGVHVSTNAGETWKNLTRNLPMVPIVDLVYHETNGTLTAASYGRSIWRLKV